MNGSLAMRSTRLRTLLLILVGGGMLLSLYLLTSSQYHLKDVRHLLDACQQQKDSLLAQLQVVYEQKNRVEKYLQQEKLEHKKTQDDNQKNNYLRLQVQKAKVEVDTKLSDLQKEQLSLQERYHELESQTKDLQEQQVQNDEKQSRLQTEYKQNFRIKDEENTLLRGNLSLVLQERDRLETQVGQLNNNIQQLKMDFFHYKRMYTEMEQRLKKLTQQQQSPISPAAEANAGAKAGEAGAPADREQKGQHSFQMENQLGHEGGGTAEHSPHNVDQRRPLPAPKIESNKGTDGGPPPSASQQTSSVAPESAAEQKESKVEEGPAGAGAGDGPAQPPSDLRQQLQPPDFGHPQPQHEEATSSKGSIPSQVGGENQPLLPPPPPSQDSKQQAPEDPQPGVPPDSHQEELGKAGLGLQSQEQKDQDTMARKPVVEQPQPQEPEHHLPGVGLMNPDLGGGGGGQENLFMGGGMPPWNPFPDLGPLARQQQQIKSPDLKHRPNGNNNNNIINNNRHQEEDENYPEDGDDDNAEEQDDTLRDKNLKPLQDHDFEDNDANDHNQAKEEGIVIAPK